MIGLEQLKRRYPDLLTPERMRKGNVYVAASLGPSTAANSEESFVEVARWEQGAAYIRVQRSASPAFEYRSVSPKRVHSVALAKGSIVVLPGLPVPQHSKMAKQQPQLFPEDVPVPVEEHRRSTSPPQAVADLDGYDERPDPLRAENAEEFLRALGEYRAWAGDPSLRAMSARCGNKVSHTTFATALKSGSLPKLPLVQALIEGCGGGDEDIRRWTTAWRRLRMKRVDDTAEDTDTSVLQFVRAHVG